MGLLPAPLSQRSGSQQWNSSTSASTTRSSWPPQWLPTSSSAPARSGFNSGASASLSPTLRRSCRWFLPPPSQANTCLGSPLLASPRHSASSFTIVWQEISHQLVRGLLHWCDENLLLVYTPSTSKYKSFLQFKLNCENVLYFNTEVVLCKVECHLF